MDEEQKQALRDLVEVNEESLGRRVLIDYAIALAVAFAERSLGLNNKMTDFVENLYKEKYDKR